MNLAKLQEYVPFVGQTVVDNLYFLAEKLGPRAVQNVNSTAVGGGVAEILNRMIPLLKELGVNARWDLIKGGQDFYAATKKFHNLLHGKHDDLTQHDFDAYLETSSKNIEEMDICGDIVFIHDPQPAALIKRKTENKWIWRCHIDLSNPNLLVWEFLKKFVVSYDAAVFSAPAFSQPLPIRQFLIAPSIDPLSDKNRELTKEYIDSVFEHYQVPADKPIITQISRFDRLKDPLGVIEAFLLVKKYIDCRLILAGGGAADDPEGMEVLAEVKNRSENNPDIHILLMPQNDLHVNALQRGSTILMQKSLKEGFGLTVSEALWKAKPIVASNVGGIPLQITHKYSGMLCSTIEGAAFALKQLLNAPEYAKKLGENGREHIRNNYLLTRHLRDYLLLFHSLYHQDNIVYL